MTRGAATFQVGATTYDRHVGRYSDALAVAHVEAAQVVPGNHALDVGCGPGAFTRALVARVGAGNVCAVDPSPSFAEACRSRAPGVDVRIGAAEQLPAFGQPFDVVGSQLVINFMTDPEAGVQAMAAAARPGGTVTSVVWDYAGEMWMLRRFWDAALDLDPDAPDEGKTMRNCTPDELANLWKRCGLTRVDVHALVVEAAYHDFDDYWAPFPSGLAPSGAYCAALPSDRQDALRQQCYCRLGSPPGGFTLTARAWFVRGTRRTSSSDSAAPPP
ncbi:MAG: trans-aconitate 2-methyltransferase [Kofleriaceae bacterium]